jgi:hypothetical protein
MINSESLVIVNAMEMSFNVFSANGTATFKADGEAKKLIEA